MKTKHIVIATVLSALLVGAIYYVYNQYDKIFDYGYKVKETQILKLDFNEILLKMIVEIENKSDIDFF